MVDVKDIQRKYTDLYKGLRNYMWDFTTVEHIADLELACYKACPDIHDIKRCLAVLRTDTFEACRDDEDLKKVFDSFKELLEESDKTYTKLYMCQEATK